MVKDCSRPRYDRPSYDRPKIWYLQGRVRGWGYDYCAAFQPLCRISVIILYPSKPLYNLSVVLYSLSMPRSLGLSMSTLQLLFQHSASSLDLSNTILWCSAVYLGLFGPLCSLCGLSVTHPS
jgi:hypothetical protein